MVDQASSIETHFEVCKQFPSPCPNMCGNVNLPRSEVGSHVQNDCPNSVVQCKYKEYGCDHQCERKDMQKHLREDAENHVLLFQRVVEEQRNELEDQRTKLDRQGEHLAQVTETMAKLSHVCQELQKDKESRDKLINKLVDQMKEQKKQQVRLEKELTHTVQRLERKDDITNSLPKSVSPSPLAHGEVETSHIWRISHFWRKLQRIKAGKLDDPFLSEPFYTTCFGYKLNGWAYLNGRGKEEGKCLSLYARVMVGEYDSILKWPIRPKYTFTLMEQSVDYDDRQDFARSRRVHDSKREDSKQSGGIHRPKRDEKSIIVGFDDFISHQDLQQRNFLDEDCLFIKISVDVGET